MAIRCFIDPLDPADDVCDTCYGSYCSDHLVRTKGRKHPICVECALKVSGVRGGGRIQPVGEPKTAKSRRQEIKQDTNRHSAAFSYFDEPDDLTEKPPAEEKKEVTERRVNATTPRPDPQPGPEISYPTLPGKKPEPSQDRVSDDSTDSDQPEPVEPVPASAFAEKPLEPVEVTSGTETTSASTEPLTAQGPPALLSGASAPAPAHDAEHTDSPNPKFAEVAQTRLSTRSEPTPLERLLAQPSSQAPARQEPVDQTTPVDTDAPDPLASFRRADDGDSTATPPLTDVPEKASETPDTQLPTAPPASSKPATSPAKPLEVKAKKTPKPEIEPEADTLPPVITSGGTILDQIIQDKQSRAQQIATKMAERLAPDET